MSEERLIALEKKVTKLESKPKDRWDILQTLGAVLVPVAIFLAGRSFSSAQQKAALEFEQRQSQHENEVAQANSRVGQAELIVSMLDELLHADPRRRRLATEAVLIAMPESGPALVRLVSENDASAEVRTFAVDALDRRRTTLVSELFADSPGKRGEAYTALMTGWAKDPSLVPELVAAARENRTNANGVNNVLVLLSHMDRDALRPHARLIDSLATSVEDIGPRTRERAATLRSRTPR